ncbi:MAG: hypothetical protein LBL69_00525, partial [Zoogloeaceae bacterium]|nr:hypothetical protein [Zoogloeaceae bacterium]
MPTVWLVWLILAFYARPGLGHDPWKNEPWLLHVLSGLPAGLPTAWGAQLQAFATRLYLPLIEAGGALSGWLGLTAWRLPSAVLLTLACVALYRAARVFYGRERAAAAPWLLCGAFGLIVRAHASEPILVWLALVALLLWAFAASPRRAGPVMVILLILGVGASIAAHWMRMPDFAFDFSGYGAALFKLIRLLPLLSWPLWPLALWSLWRFRRQRREPGYVLPVAAFVLALFIVPMGFVPGRMEEALM